MIWVCTKCGHEMESEKHPDLCPMCYAPMHHMIPKKGQEDKKNEKKEEKQSPPCVAKLPFSVDGKGEFCAYSRSASMARPLSLLMVRSTASLLLPQGLSWLR